MKIYCCQFDIAWENKEANYAKVEDLLREARPEPGSLLLLPEMFSTGFSMDVASIAERIPSLTEEFLARTAREYEIYLQAGIVRPMGDHGANQAVVFSPQGELLARYAKMQPFTLGGESQHYRAGDQTTTFAWRQFKVSPFICYDLRFPELFRAAIKRDVHLFTVIANWPVTRIQHWVTLLQARAIENQAYVAGVNRCGKDPKLTYNGRSLIINPHGEILVDAGDGERVISAELDLKGLLAWRTDFPALKDMRMCLEESPLRS